MEVAIQLGHRGGRPAVLWIGGRFHRRDFGGITARPVDADVGTIDLIAAGPRIFQLASFAMKTVHKMALMTAVSAAVTTYASFQVAAQGGDTRVFALVFAILGLLNTVMFGAAYAKLRKG
jgi:hypothetical protein